MKKREDENKKQHFRPQTCRNCGVNGHLYKDCFHPIMSFVIICYKLLKYPRPRHNLTPLLIIDC